MRQGARPQAADARLTRRAFSTSIVAAMLAGTALANAADSGGWDRARWGMTADELAAAFGGDLRPVEPPMVFGPLIARQVVPRVAVAGRPFIAFLQLDAKTGRLSQVLLRYRGRNPTHSDCEAVAAALTSALGAPSGSDSASDYSGSFPSFAVSREWRLPTTAVTLGYQDPNAKPYSGVRKELTIRYRPAGAER